MNVNFELTGEMPLLIHADDVEASDHLRLWRNDPSNKNVSVAGDDRSPAWTWQTYLYSDGDHATMPAENIMACLRAAGAKMIMKKQKTFKEITQSGMFIPGEFCELLIGGKQIEISKIEGMRDLAFAIQAEQVAQLGFRLFVKRARVGTAKHIRVRPRFDQWSVRGVMRVTVPEITFDVLTQLFDLAGRVGIGDWRPGCKSPGPFGMFTTKLKQSA